MKKLSFILIFTVGLFFAGNAQFSKGSNAIDIGIGPSWHVYDSNYGYYGWTVKTKIGPALMFNFEHGTIDIPNAGVIGFGGMLGFKYFRYKYNDDFTNSDIFLIPAFRAAFHFQFFDSGNFDLYAGLATGPKIHTEKWHSWEYNPSTGRDHWVARSDTYVHFYSDFFVGSRYMFSEGFGVFAELGYGICYLKGGVSFKF